MRISSIKNVSNQIQDQDKLQSQSLVIEPKKLSGIKKTVRDFLSKILPSRNNPKTLISESDLEKLKKEGKQDASRTHDKF